MKAILIIMDTLNRHMLSCYNSETWVKTPNMDRLARKSVVFDNHWIGSTPCIPARRDLMTGRLNFLDRSWGPIEPFDITLPDVLRNNQVISHIITDHDCYFHKGGENYCQAFDTWDYIRGGCHDTWISNVAQQKKGFSPYRRSSSRYHTEQDFPGSRTFQAAGEWLKTNCHEDDWCLWVETFDPHEPFHCTSEFNEMYDNDQSGICGPNTAGAYEQRMLPDDIRIMQKSYAAKLSMIDRQLGNLLDVIDDHALWDDTMIILTTDHGFLLGEHNFTAKLTMHQYNELANIPLLVHLPKTAFDGKRTAALTQAIDIMPTILSYFKADIPVPVQGYSLIPLVERTVTQIRETALFGMFGLSVNITDGKFVYMRSPAAPENWPCFQYTAMPTSWNCFLGNYDSSSFWPLSLTGHSGYDRIHEIEMGRLLKHTNYPVYKIPATYQDKPDTRPFFDTRENLLFDLLKDYQQQDPLKNLAIENEMIRKLVSALEKADAPEEQFERLGLRESVEK